MYFRHLAEKDIDVECEECAFVGEVEGTLNGDAYDWKCPECGMWGIVDAGDPDDTPDYRYDK